MITLKLDTQTVRDIFKTDEAMLQLQAAVIANINKAFIKQNEKLVSDHINSVSGLYLKQFNDALNAFGVNIKPNNYGLTSEHQVQAQNRLREEITQIVRTQILEFIKKEVSDIINNVNIKDYVFNNLNEIIDKQLMNFDVKAMIEKRIDDIISEYVSDDLSKQIISKLFKN